MRNLKKILCLALVLSMVLAVISGAAYTNYTDDAELTMVNEDYLLAAQLLQDIGVVVGVKNPEDGKTYYYPDQLLTRAELARVLYVLYSGTTDSSVYDPDLFRDELATTFTDISGHWAEGYIKYGQAMGYLNGKSAEIFDPDANVKAQEMATALLIVLGYKAADLSPNYPVNVVKYGYTNNKGNLFTTGLSTAAASGGDHGMHIVGLGAAVGANEKDIEGEYQLERELTREEAFYMMYKAIAQRSMVSKRLFVGDNGTNVDGTYYYPIGIEYVNYKFNVGFDQTTETDWVAGSNDIAFTGYDKALYNENNVATSIYTGNYGKAGYVYLDKTGLVRDFGYTAEQGTAQGSDQGFGYILSATDWNAQIGREIKFTLTTWNSKKFITEYAFSYGTGEKTAVRGFTGATLDIKKTKTLKVENDALVIDGISYIPYSNTTTQVGKVNLITNNGVGVKVTLAELLTAIYDADKKSPDSIKVYYKTTSDPKVCVLYGVVEEENVFAKVTISEDQAEKGEAQLNFLDDSTLVIKNSYELADGDRVFGYFDQKTLGQATYDATAANFKNGAAKAALYDGMTFVFAKVAATTVDNVVTDVVTDANGTKTKYFIEKVDGVEFQMGKASKLADAYVGKTYDFKANETAYWALYIVDGYCYEAEKVATEASKDLYVTAVKKDVNTADNKVTYVFTLNTKANGTGDAYTFTKSDAANKLAKYDVIANGDVVRYNYDTKTNAAKDITKLIKIEATTEDEALTGYTQTWAVAQKIQAAMATADANPNAIVVYYGMPMLKDTSAPYAETEAYAIKDLSQDQYELIQPYLNGTKNMEFTK